MTTIRTDDVPFKLGRQAKAGARNPYPDGSHDAERWEAGYGRRAPVAAPVERTPLSASYTGMDCRWTDDELTALRGTYGKVDIAVVEAALPKRTRGAIREMAKRIGVAKADPVIPWTAEDNRDLRRYINKGLLPDQIAPLLGRTPNAVQQHAYRLGASFPKPKPAQKSPQVEPIHNQGA